MNSRLFRVSINRGIGRRLILFPTVLSFSITYMILRIPTELNEEQIKEFQKLYFERFGEEISREEAIEEGLSLIRLIAIVIDKSV